MALKLGRGEMEEWPELYSHVYTCKVVMTNFVCESIMNTTVVYHGSRLELVASVYRVSLYIRP